MARAGHGEPKEGPCLSTRKKYRGKGRSKKNRAFSVLLTNMRGFQSKQSSLQRVIKKVKPSMIAINETQLVGRRKVDLNPYLCWTKNRTEGKGGGICTAVAPEYRDSAVGAGEGEGGDEYMVTRVEAFSPAFNLINCYGEQRSLKVEEVEEKWRRLRKVMEEVRARGEHCLLAGDLNKLVGCDEWGVEGGHPEVSPGGRLLRELLMTGEWVLVNAMGEEVVEGGPFTREDPATGALSTLDLFIVNKELAPYVSKLTIDSKKKITVARVIKKKKEKKFVFSDHFSCIIKFKNLQMKKEETKRKETKWNLMKKNGWKDYKVISDDYCDQLEKVIENNNVTIEEAMKRFEKIHNQIKYKSFGKVTLKNRETKGENKTNKDDENSVWEEQERKTEEEIEDIKKTKGGRVGRIWMIRKRVIGNSKKPAPPSAIMNPITNKLAVNKKEIKEVSLNYCKETLANNETKPEYVKLVQKKKEETEEIMKANDGDFEPTKESLELNIRKFKRSGKRNYDFFINAGKKFQETVFKFCQRMFKEEIFPTQFSETTLHMIYKGKGKTEHLPNNRFIHTKPWFPRVAESLLVQGAMKGPLLAGSSIYQVGGQPGHRAEELVFCMKSVIAKQRKENKVVLLQLYDISKFFDKETMEDAVLTCQKRRVDPKATRLWKKLQDNTRIRVRTGAGMSDYGEVGAVLGQGTLGGALVSQAVLDEGMSEQFLPGGEGELEYGEVPLAPFIFQDDVIHGVGGLEEAREANRRVARVMGERCLSLNQGKTVCIILGSKKQKEEVRKEMRRNPLMCGDFETREVEADKWLGQQVSGGGLAASVFATVASREAKVRGACLEIADIVNDWRARVAGGLGTAFMLWETCIIPSLLYGAGTWVEISTATTKRLNDIQRWFVRLVMQVGPGAPLTALTRETGLLDMGLRVDREKAMFVLFIRSLDDETLAKQVYEEQKKNNWPGLAKETKEICERLEVEDVNETLMSKKEYKEIFNEACEKEDEMKHKKQTENKEKCNIIRKDMYGRQKYIDEKTIHETRELFRTRVRMQPFAGNFKSDKRFAKTNWLCRCLIKKEEEDHLKFGNCPQYKDIRERYDSLEEDEILARYFGEVLARRDALDEGASGGLPATVALLAEGDPGDLGDSEASQSGGLGA